MTETHGHAAKAKTILDSHTPNTVVHGSCLCGAAHIAFARSPLETVSISIYNPSPTAVSLLLHPLSPTVDSPIRDQVLCHCDHCKKISGAPYSANIVVPTSSIVITGAALQSYSITSSGSGLPCAIYFCGTCSSVLFSRGECYPGLTMVKAGILDGANVMDESVPGMELFGGKKVCWVGTHEGSIVLEGAFEGFDESVRTRGT